MRLILTVLALMTSLALTPLQAQEAGPDAPGDIVTRQFDAFRTDNLDEAFSYASPMIQFQFQDPQNFGMMVERGYPMVRDPGQVRMLDLREEGSGGVRECGGCVSSDSLARRVSRNCFLGGIQWWGAPA